MATTWPPETQGCPGLARGTGGTFPNVGAECGAGVAGIVGALGEVAASASLAMTSCKEFPLAGAGQ